jgi:hypothetical protein
MSDPRIMYGRHQKQASCAKYWRLTLLLFAVAVWGLNEEDIHNHLPSIKLNRELFQCPICDRQKVAPSDATQTCQGTAFHRHPEEQMVPMSRPS